MEFLYSLNRLNVATSKILMLARVALQLTVRSGSAFSLRPSHLVMASAGPCRTVGLQFGLQTPTQVSLSSSAINRFPRHAPDCAAGGRMRFQRVQMQEDGR
jgi:hypothetical protein